MAEGCGIKDIIEGRKEPGVFLGVLLSLLSVVYGIIVRLRAFLYSAGVLNGEKLPCAVVSVGNITVGGSGKTPVTEFLARRFKEAGRRPAILSRGYGRVSAGAKVVSDGKNILLGVKDSGDEPQLLAKKLNGIPVVVAEKRAEGGRLLIEKFSPDVIILDDGFQHLGLKRDANVLLVDKDTPVARLLPRGGLREPLCAARRADLVLVKGEGADKSVAARLTGPDKPAFSFKYEFTGIEDICGTKADGIKSIAGKKVFALSAVARPESFLATLKEAGVVVAGSASYPDHHWFSEADIKDVEARAKENGAEFIVTTEKDAVRLEGVTTSVPVKVITIKARIEGEDEFFGAIIKKLGF